MKNNKLVRLSTICDLFDGCDYNTPVGIPFLLSILEQLPAVDAVEVRHGHWYTLTDCSNSGTYCSECHTKIFDFTHKPKDKLSRYCPACGARMDGRRRDGDT